MLTLRQLITLLESLAKSGGADDNSLVMGEGYDGEGRFVQTCVDGATVEARCNPDDEPPAVILALTDIDIDE